jgi:hypothetical protein
MQLRSQVGTCILDNIPMQLYIEYLFSLKKDKEEMTLVQKCVSMAFLMTHLVFHTPLQNFVLILRFVSHYC